MLAAKSEIDVKGCTVMALLDGGTLRRHKSWLKVGILIVRFLIKLDRLGCDLVSKFNFSFRLSHQQFWLLR